MTNDDNQNSKTNLIIIIIAGITLVLILAIAVLAGIYQYNNPVKTGPEQSKPQTCEETKTCPQEPKQPVTRATDGDCPELNNDCAKPKEPNYPSSYIQPSQPDDKPITYPKQKSEWGQKYKDLVATTEKNKFTAIYLDQSLFSNKFIDKETLDKPAINYAWSDFKNIKSENLYLPSPTYSHTRSGLSKLKIFCSC